MSEEMIKDKNIIYLVALARDGTGGIKKDNRFRIKRVVGNKEKDGSF